MTTLLRILIVEDSEDDTLLVLHQIKKGGYNFEFERVDTAEKMRIALTEKKWNIVLSDYVMPHFNGLEALSILKEYDLDIPFIVISGTIGEEVAVDAMKAGAHDYVMKNNLQRLLPAIERELNESEQRAEKRLLEQKHNQVEELLRQSENNLQVIIESTADGILAIDSNGKVIKTNNRFTELWGIPPDILNSGDDATLLNFVLEQLIDPEQFLNKVQQLYNSKEEDTDTILFKDGRVFERYSAPLLSDDKIIGRVWSFRDITERKRVEAALLESESRYRMLFNANADGILIADIENKTFNYANPAICRMLGYTEDELRTMSLVDIHPEQDLLRVTNEFKSISQGDKTLVTDIPCRRKDGSIVYADINTNTININGRPCAVGLFRDITERKNAEESLQHERTLLRLLIDNIPDLIYSKDTACRKTLTNLADVRHLGAKSDEEVLGKDDFAFFPKEIAEKFYADDQSVIQSGQPILNREEYTFDEEGHKKWLLTSKFPLIDEKCQIVGLVGITHDFTKRKQEEEALRESEKRFRLLFELSPEAIMLIDPFDKQADWPIVDCNETACKMSGYTREELIGKSIDIVNTTHGTHEERVEYLNKLRVEPILHIETFHRHKDGHVFPIEVSTSIITFQGREMVLGIDRDITERKQAEEEIKQKNSQLQKLNAEKDLLFSIIAHDLKSPFNSIIGFSNILAENAEERNLDEVSRYANIIKQSSERVLELLVTLMDWSRSQTGRIQFNPEYFELSELVNQTTLLFNNIIEQKALIVTIKIEPRTSVYADKSMMGTVLRNLISNAIKFSKPKGEITISASIKQNEANILVKDTGIGMSREAIEKLFQVDRIYSTPGTLNEKGTGLGLVICKELVEKHDGKIWVESKLEDPATGKSGSTTFCITIPFNIKEVTT